jgi:hypothetical protein
MPGQSEQPKQRGAVGGMPTKVVRVKPGKASSPDWHDCVVEIDGMPPHDVEAVVDVRGGVQLHNVVLRARLDVTGDSELVNVWAGAAAGLQRGYAVPVLASDPDMQVENNHKALSFGGGTVTISRLSAQNNDDVVQLGRRVDVTIRDSRLVLLNPYLGDHRDTIDADDVRRLLLVNTLVQGCGNSSLFAKQETDAAEMTLLQAEHCRFVNQWPDDSAKRQGHMVWLGFNTKTAVLRDNEWDARPLQTLLVPKTTALTDDGNVYYNDAPPLSASRRAKGRAAGEPIQVTYHLGV